MRRRQAVDKINSLPEASEQQLSEFDDVCAICYQELTTARITRCRHYFHGVCLRKWLYVQDICPLCHEVLCVETEPQVDENSNDHIHPEDVIFHVNPIPEEDTHSSSDSDSSSTAEDVIQESVSHDPEKSEDLPSTSVSNGIQLNVQESIINNELE